MDLFWQLVVLQVRQSVLCVQFLKVHQMEFRRVQAAFGRLVRQILDCFPGSPNPVSGRLVHQSWDCFPDSLILAGEDCFPGNLILADEDYFPDSRILADEDCFPGNRILAAEVDDPDIHPEDEEDDPVPEVVWAAKIAMRKMECSLTPGVPEVAWAEVARMAGKKWCSVPGFEGAIPPSLAPLCSRKYQKYHEPSGLLPVAS